MTGTEAADPIEILAAGDAGAPPITLEQVIAAHVTLQALPERLPRHPSPEELDAMETLGRGFSSCGEVQINMRAVRTPEMRKAKTYGDVRHVDFFLRYAPIGLVRLARAVRELRGEQPETPDTAAVRAQLDAADEMVRRLCLPRGNPETREWVMSIPARPDEDPDLVIGQALHGARTLLARNVQLTAALEAAAADLEHIAETMVEVCGVSPAERARAARAAVTGGAHVR